MKKLDYLTKAIEAVTAVILAILTVLLFVQVVRRFVFNASYAWAEEVAIYGMIWITFLGAVLCLRYGEHTRIDVVINLLPHKIRKWVEVFDYLLCFAFMMFTAYHSIPLMKMMGKFTAAASGVPMGLVYSCMLVSAILMIPYFGILIYQKIVEKEVPKAPSTTDDIDSSEGGAVL